MAKPKIVCVVGTRPDAIKSAPVVQELRRHADAVDAILISTGQHREILRQALSVFGLEPDFDLAVMQPGQSLAELTSRILSRLDAAIGEVKPDLVLAQGDTTTTFVASMVAFYREIPFGHIEAGLRTPTIDNPFPEEFNRRASTLVARQHYAPTSWARENLAREGVDSDGIFVTGNTGIDAVMYVAEACNKEWFPGETLRPILLTTHRRESWGEPQQRICRAARRLLDRFEDTMLVVPMHPNPIVRDTLQAELASHPRVHLIEPPFYPEFVKLMQHSTIILTDSGGVQEEAPSFGVPVLVLRDTTERPEGIQAGVARLVGTDENAIFTEAERLLADDEAYARMAFSSSPYGDGRASARIRHAAFQMLGVESRVEAAWA